MNINSFRVTLRRGLKWTILVFRSDSLCYEILGCQVLEFLLLQDFFELLSVTASVDGLQVLQEI